jgi:Flp pilus assembly protein TadG
MPRLMHNMLSRIRPHPRPGHTHPGHTGLRPHLGRAGLGRAGLGRAGNVMLIVALAMVPLAGMVALAVDFGQVNVVKGKLDLAADEAALLATTAASNAWNAGDVNAVAEAIVAAQARFQAQTANLSIVAINPPVVVLTQNGGLFNATVTYTAAMPTTFARVVGITTLPLGGTSSSSLSLNPYIDIQILMDVSSSMTLAATPAGMAAMVSMVAAFNGPVTGDSSKGCTLACHWSTTDDYYIRAVKQNIPLRITVLRAAVSNLIDTLVALDTHNRFRLGLYTFAQALNPSIYDVSTDLSGAKTSLPGIAPDIICPTCLEPETFFSLAMASLTKIVLPPPLQANMTPQRFVFIVTDGVYDQTFSGNRQLGAFRPADCAALKALGVSILVLYTPYTAPVPANAFYVNNILPFAPQIVPNLQACASSPAYFFVANDATAINTQLQNMLQLVVQSSSHLTN